MRNFSFACIGILRHNRQPTRSCRGNPNGLVDHPVRFVGSGSVALGRPAAPAAQGPCGAPVGLSRVGVDGASRHVCHPSVDRTPRRPRARCAHRRRRGAGRHRPRRGARPASCRLALAQPGRTAETRYKRAGIPPPRGSSDSAHVARLERPARAATGRALAGGPPRPATGGQTRGSGAVGGAAVRAGHRRGARCASCNRSGRSTPISYPR